MAKATHLNRPYEAVTVVLSNYFDALYESDAAKLSRVFHPLAHYVCVSDGTLQYLRMNEYLPIVENRPSPASRGELRHDRIRLLHAWNARLALNSSMTSSR
jgi:4-oxalocrotonate tautomerase